MDTIFHILFITVGTEYYQLLVIDIIILSIIN